MVKKKAKHQQLVGIIPAAGKGSRLAPFPCPKELFPVGYQDFHVNGAVQRRPKVVSQYLIENIIAAGAEKLLIIVSEGKGDLMKYYADGKKFNADVCYLFQEEQTGMPGAIDLAKNWISGSTVIFGMPDTIIEPSNVFDRLLKFHQSEKSDLTLGLFPTNLPSKFGMVELDADNNVTNTIDKPKSSDLKYMWGCAVWSPVFTDLLHDFLEKNVYDGKEIVLGDVFNEAIRRLFKVKGLAFDDGQYIDIGTTEELDQALKKFHL